MSDIASVFIVILAATIHAFLQLGIGTMLLLYHASLGHHIKKKTRALASSYISGIGYITILSLATTCFIASFIFTGAIPVAVLAVVCGVLAVVGIVSWAIYYRISSGTELWVPAVVARYINTRAKITKSNTEAFSLGFLTFIGELPFSLILLIVAAFAILSLPWNLQLLAVALYTIIVLLPVVIIRLSIRQGKTVVEIQRWRVHHKKFFRFFIGSAFIVLAVFVLSFKVIGA